MQRCGGFIMAGQATLCAAWLGFSSRPTPSPPRRRKIVCPAPPRNEEGKKQNLRRRRGWKGLDVVGPLRVKLRNSPVFSFITSARISSASRTAFYIPPRNGKNSFVHEILQDFQKLKMEIYLRRKLIFSSTEYSGQCL